MIINHPEGHGMRAVICHGLDANVANMKLIATFEESDSDCSRHGGRDTECNYTSVSLLVPRVSAIHHACHASQPHTFQPWLCSFKMLRRARARRRQDAGPQASREEVLPPTPHPASPAAPGSLAPLSFPSTLSPREALPS